MDPNVSFHKQIAKKTAIVPPDADGGSVADAIVKVVDAPLGKCPFRVHIDPHGTGRTLHFL
jgi:hypothetical protein